MRIVPAILAIAGALAFSDAAVVARAAELTRADVESWFDGFVPHALQQADIAGALVLVIKDGVVLLQKGYGYADVDGERPMDPQRTIVGVGSVSKLFTWTAVMQQVEQGRLDLDRDINDYLDLRIPPAFDRPITLRDLMTHTAGFEERMFRRCTAPRALGDYLRAVPVPDRIYPPGEVPACSSSGAMLGGSMPSCVSGERFVEYVERHIFAPLGMGHSTFRRPLPRPLEALLARNYRVASSSEALPLYDEEPAGDPSGHLSTTADDISRFMRAHLLQGRFGDYQLLDPETMRLMHTTAFVPLP